MTALRWAAVLLLAALVLGSPLPLAGVLPGSAAVLQLAAFAALVLAALAAEDVRRAGQVLLPAAALAGIAAVGVAQGLTGRSAAPAVSLQAALSWAAVAAALVAAALIARRRSVRRILGGALALSATFQVLYGARQWMAGSREILGVTTGAEIARLRGTFGNPDHLAVYLGLVLPAALAWAWWSVRRTNRGSVPPERRVAQLAPPVLIWLLLFVGLAFTGSRAGLVAAVAAALGQGLLLLASRRGWRAGALGLLAPVVGLALVAAVGLQAGLGRWLATTAYEVTWNERLQTYDASLELWLQHPLTGTGLASFREAFPTVQPADLGGTWMHAHNDWLELLVTTGVAGAVVMLVGIGALLRQHLLSFRLGLASEDRAAGLAALGAAVHLGVHSAFDFGLSMPANALTFAILAGAAAGVHRQQPLDGGRETA